MGAGDTLMTTATVAAQAGYSAQHVRDLEGLGVIHAAARSPSGYRLFSAEHVHELRAYRDLAYALGPVEARRTMRDLRSQPAGHAAAMLCGLHARLDSEREQALTARRALEAIPAEATTDAPPVAGDSMTITELSQALGVRPSTLRFWEKAGLVAPDRIATRAGTARRYSVAAIREARITRALRAGGYRIPDVQKAIAAVRALDDTSDTVAALDARLETIARRMLALLRTGSRLAELIAEANQGTPAQ